MTFAISRPPLVGRCRLSALMIPVVKDWSRPNGLPIANTDWPTLRSSECRRNWWRQVPGGIHPNRPPHHNLARYPTTCASSTWPDASRTASSIRAFDHMVVGDDVSCLIPHESRARLRGHPFRVGRRLQPGCESRPLAPRRETHARTAQSLSVRDRPGFRAARSCAALWPSRTAGRNRAVRYRRRGRSKSNKQKPAETMVHCGRSLSQQAVNKLLRVNLFPDRKIASATLIPKFASEAAAASDCELRESGHWLRYHDHSLIWFCREQSLNVGLRRSSASRWFT